MCTLSATAVVVFTTGLLAWCTFISPAHAHAARGRGTVIVSADPVPSVARYDYYRLYRVRFENMDQVVIFQELERVTDAVIFYGHAHHIGQSLTVLVAAHKIADFTELLRRFHVEHKILVREQKLPVY